MIVIYYHLIWSIVCYIRPLCEYLVRSVQIGDDIFFLAFFLLLFFFIIPM